MGQGASGPVKGQELNAQAADEQPTSPSVGEGKGEVPASSSSAQMSSCGQVLAGQLAANNAPGIDTGKCSCMWVLACMRLRKLSNGNQGTVG
jgi:hypothetical protein